MIIAYYVFFMLYSYYRISPDDDDDEDLKEFEELQKKQQNREKLSMIEKGKLFVEELVQKVGFFGILACASVRFNFYKHPSTVLTHTIVVDPQSFIRSSWNYLRTFSSPVLDLFRSNFDRKSCD